jgi:TonB family protein
LDEAKAFKKHWVYSESEESLFWNGSEIQYVFQDWCFVDVKTDQLFPKIVQRTVNGQTYTLPIHEIFLAVSNLRRKKIFTSKDFKEISLAFNSLGIENEYLRDVVLRYSDIRTQFRQQRIDETKSTRTAELRRSIPHNLSGRSVGVPVPAYYGKGKGEGVVVVEITINQDGKVTSARAIGRGSTTQDSKLWKAAEEAALKARFNVKEDAPISQKGTITYVFKLN